jgi:hypothetical protein
MSIYEAMNYIWLIIWIALYASHDAERLGLYFFSKTKWLIIWNNASMQRLGMPH